jgi:hypothetical protein
VTFQDLYAPISISIEGCFKTFQDHCVHNIVYRKDVSGRFKTFVYSEECFKSS